MWIRQRLVWPSRGPLAPHVRNLRSTLDTTYQAEARRTPAYRAWLDRRAAKEDGR